MVSATLTGHCFGFPTHYFTVLVHSVVLLSVFPAAEAEAEAEAAGLF